MRRTTANNLEAAYRANLAGVPIKPPKSNAGTPKAKIEAYGLPRPKEATHRQIVGLPQYDNKTRKGSWVRVTERGRRVSVEVYSNCGGIALMDCTEAQFNLWFEEIAK